MPDLTGTPTPLGIGTYNVDADAPSGLGFNEAMGQIDALIAARVGKPAGVVVGDVPVWNGTTWVRPSGTPDATKFLRGDGSWQAVAAGSLVGMQVFTANGTYTPTSGTTRILVEAQGAGGAGGGASSSAAGGNGETGGSGGGGGGYARKLLTSGFSGLAVVVGAGGTGVAGGTGNTGGDTTFGGTVVVAKGGTGGQASSNFNIGGGSVQQTIIGGGATPAGSVGDLVIPGSGGKIQIFGSSAVAVGANGGDSFMGKGGIAGSTSTGTATAGGIGYLYGGGGGGAAGVSTATTAAGGVGAAGILIIWEFA